MIMFLIGAAVGAVAGHFWGDILIEWAKTKFAKKP